MKHHEKRDAAFKEWLEDDCEIPLPLDPEDREIAELGLKEAFDAGWEARTTQNNTTQRLI